MLVGTSYAFCRSLHCLDFGLSPLDKLINQNGPGAIFVVVAEVVVDLSREIKE